MPEQEGANYGGQAIVEGVMMRSPNYFSVACRAPNGKIIVRTEPIEKTWIGRQKWLKLPFLRGTFAILDAMALGMRSMRFSSEVQMDPGFQPGGEAEKSEIKAPSKTMQTAAIVGAMVVGIGLGIVLFNIIPQAMAQFTGVKSGDQRGFWTNYLAEAFKMVIFLGYLWLISRMAAIQDVFKYHGAEHKAINALEAKLDLNVENTQAQTRLHPRCGTSFAIIVFIIGLFLLPLIPRYPVTGKPGNPFVDVSVRVLIELCILPIIAGISFELLKLAGKFRDQRWVQMASWPGLMSQKVLTTIEPEDRHCEVAIASLRGVVDAEETGAILNTDDYDALGEQGPEKDEAPNCDVASAANETGLADEAGADRPVAAHEVPGDHKG